MAENVHRQDSKREKFYLFNSLVILAQGVEGKYTTVDLRNESSVSGRIDIVDGLMNLNMSNVVFMDARGKEYAYDSFFVHARNIRYIHIPDELPIVPTIEKQLVKLGHRPARPQFTTTFKGNKLMQRQQETLQLVQQMKANKSSQESQK